MLFHNLSKGTRIVRASNGVAAGVTPVVCPTIDISGFNGILMIAVLGTITATGVAVLKATAGAAADGSDAAEVEGSAVTANDAQDNKLLVLDIHKPKNGQQFFTPVLDRTVANVGVDAILVVLYNASQSPVDVDATVAALKVLSEPSLGEAG
jgi:hypothetical protein